MSRWRTESAYVGRYVGTGAFNTLVGFGIIFGLMWLGASPLVANVAGYGCGFLLGFVLSRKLVFRSAGRLQGEATRYVAVFLAAFLLNLAVLQLSLGWLGFPPVLAQLAGAGTFTLAMYAMTRLYVFSPR